MTTSKPAWKWCLDDLAPYIGKWIAVKDGHVIDSDADLKALYERQKSIPDYYDQPLKGEII